MKRISALLLLVMLSVSLRYASAEEARKTKPDSVRHALDAYDKILVPRDRKNFETLISGMEIGLRVGKCHVEGPGTTDALLPTRESQAHRFPNNRHYARGDES
jgi:hypothetical protein